MKQKAYPLHESVYVKMKKQGIESWNGRNGSPAIDPDTERFFADAVAQPWFPREGRVLEMGCGTGPLLRWFGQRGFSGLGIDVSKTAINMAKAQSKGMALRFRVGDICDLDVTTYPQHDVCLDGHCFHCIITPEDRARMLANCRRLLKPDGVFILMAMCSPVNREVGFDCDMRMYGNYIYVPSSKAGDFEKSRTFCGKPYFPNRYIGHWKTILADVRTAGFSVQLARFNRCTQQEFCSDILICATPQ